MGCYILSLLVCYGYKYGWSKISCTALGRFSGFTVRSKSSKSINYSGSLSSSTNFFKDEVFYSLATILPAWTNDLNNALFGFGSCQGKHLKAIVKSRTPREKISAY